MCGRFSLTVSGLEIAAKFNLEEVPDISPRYNIAPSQAIASIVVGERSGKRQLEWMRWGLIPSGAKEAKMGARLINARAETVAEKPAFRTAFKGRRCLIIADGFYEWQQQGKQKQPYYFRVRSNHFSDSEVRSNHFSDSEVRSNHFSDFPALFAFAGLWDNWQSGEGEKIVSCTILTTAANEQVGHIHQRMPVIMPPAAYSQWLDPENKNPQELLPLLEQNANIDIVTYPVSSTVNNDRAECIQAIA